MAPPEHPFPVSTLPSRLQYQLTAQSALKPRKLRADFDLKRDCELMELVQYSCTTWQEAMIMSGRREECWPVVRLFRRCRERSGKVFHVETTAWEGEGAWKMTRTGSGRGKGEELVAGTTSNSSSRFADYGSYFGRES